VELIKKSVQKSPVDIFQIYQFVYCGIVDKSKKAQNLSSTTPEQPLSFSNLRKEVKREKRAEAPPNQVFHSFFQNFL
jgi:hypothetical protein